MSEVGFGREAFVAVRASEGLLLGVNATVTQQLGGHAECFTAVRALEAPWLRVDAPVVLQRHEVHELFVARAAEEGARLVTVAVVKERAGVAVRPSALVAHVGLLRGPACL